MSYAMRMRTWISLDDRLAERVRRRAAEERLSVTALIARILDDVLERRDRQPEPPYRLVTVGGEGTYPGVDLDQPRTLLVAEDRARDDDS